MCREMRTGEGPRLLLHLAKPTSALVSGVGSSSVLGFHKVAFTHQMPVVPPYPCRDVV